MMVKKVHAEYIGGTANGGMSCMVYNKNIWEKFQPKRLSFDAKTYLANTYIYLPPLSISPIALIPSVNLRLCFSHIGLISSGFVANILEVGKRGLVRFFTSPSADLLAEMAWNEGGNERKGLLQVISRRLWTARKMATMSASLIIASTIDIERTIRSFVVV